MKFVRAMLMMSVAAIPALANVPTFDNSGNSLLSGTYYFREVIYVAADGAGNLGQEYAAFGTIAFNGSGGYTISNATENSCTSQGCGQQPFSTTGTYTFGANGYGFFQNPLASTYSEYGLVSNNTLVASVTEGGFNSLFIATLVSSPAATNSAFQGNYQLAGFFPSGSAANAADVTYQLNPDGAGNLGTVNLTGYAASGGSTVFTQTSTVKYSFSNGAGIITFPTSNTANFYSGTEYMYISPDRNFVFGGSPNDFDMFVGVKKATSAVNFNGIYFEAGLDMDATQYASSGVSAMDTYYGTLNALSDGNVIGHERIYYAIPNFASGFSYNTTYPSTASTGAYTVTAGAYSTQYTFGNGGAIRIGFGVGPSMGLNVALQAPTLTGSGVYLNPMGVVNAATFAPFTAGVSPGEIVVLYGSNLAPSLQQATSLPLPTTLNGVQVTVNGVPAPIYYVSPTQMSVVIPYSATYSVTSGFPIARIVVTNASGTSNAVTEFFNLTSPGVFTQTANGIGTASVYHVTSKGFTAVTPSNPAQPGETVVAYVAGMGNTVPSVMEGTATPTTFLANTVNNFSIYVGGSEACGPETTATPCPFVGLAPFLADVYQFNIPIPSTATTGTSAIDIVGPDFESFQALSLPIGTSNASSVLSVTQPEDVRARPSRLSRPLSPKARVVPCFRNNPTCSAASN